MLSPFQQFKQLHQQPGLLLLPNAWDVKSALQLQDEQFPAIATSSAAVANSLGYEDGEGMPFEEYLLIIRRIRAAVKIPLSVDMEMGYGDSHGAVYANVKKLIELGVAGINLEDSHIQNRGRALQDAGVFANKLSYIKDKLFAENLELFINVRCDTYLLNVPGKQQETTDRIQLYEKAGADGIFLPCASAIADITAAVHSTSLPISLMGVPGLPDLKTLANLGVKRVSMGAFLFEKIYSGIAPLMQEIKAADDCAPLFS
jgi:2-methylisocitrate lyase-like PEP mutase family enzyme